MLKNWDFHLFETEYGQHALLTNGSRIFDIKSSDNASQTLEALQLPQAIDGKSLPPPPLYSLSLNIAQACNMSCSYCYAEEGSFGRPAKLMSEQIAFASIDRLLIESGDSDSIVIGFIGGEPLLNKKLLHRTTQYAAKAAERTGKKAKFSITTNLTLVKKEDVALFRDFAFNITVSIDGDKQRNDKQRLLKTGNSAYQAVLDALGLMQQHGLPRHLSARITVPRHSSGLLEQLKHVIGLGFDDAGFAPVLSAPDANTEIAQNEFTQFLAEMVRCGEYALEQLLDGQNFPFANLETALFELHRGTHRPYPCGAGAGYLSVNAEGKLYACHRLIDDTEFDMGSVQEGSNYSSRERHLNRSHVDKQTTCQTCWARYLCGGGCHHEVKHRGRPSCDYIRGWLDFCLKSYIILLEKRPEYFLRQEGNPQLAEVTIK